MCWTCSNYTNGHIARKDIKVYKLVKVEKGKYFSWYKNYEYKPNELQLLINIKLKPTIGGWKIEEGYHSYNMRLACQMNKALHMEALMVECIIPQGTKFYKNYDGCLVSEQIILKR